MTITKRTILEFALAFFALAVLAWAATLSVHAQDVPAIEASAGIAFVPLVHTTNSPGESFVYPEGARQGFYASIHVPLNDVVGLEAQGSRTAGRFVAIPGKHVYSDEFFGGLRFSDRELSKNVIPYFSVLTGTIYRPYLLSYSGYWWGVSLGAGVSVYPSKHVGSMWERLT